MALIIKLYRPFGVIKINARISGDFGRNGNQAVEVPDDLANALEGYRVPQYRKVVLPANYAVPLTPPQDASTLPPPPVEPEGLGGELTPLNPDVPPLDYEIPRFDVRIESRPFEPLPVAPKPKRERKPKDPNAPKKERKPRAKK